MEHNTTITLFPNPLHASRIQDLDGGFFEKFGSILRQKSINHDESIAGRLEPFPEEEGVESAYAAAHEAMIAEPADDSGNETLPDSDSEEQQEKQNEFIGDAFGWNVSNVCFFSIEQFRGITTS